MANYRVSIADCAGTTQSSPMHTTVTWMNWYIITTKRLEAETMNFIGQINDIYTIYLMSLGHDTASCIKNAISNGYAGEIQD